MPFSSPHALTEAELRSVECLLQAAAASLAGKPGSTDAGMLACCGELRAAVAQLERMRRVAHDEKLSAALIPSVQRLRQAACQVKLLLQSAAAFYAGLFSAPLPAAEDYAAGDYTAEGRLNSSNLTGRVWLDA
jgi:hypothetical protein